VFPGLRARLKDRFVELVDVDLRWGITVEQAERGEVLPICLAEIDRARPFFVGMLGERYGWIPPADAYALDLLETARLPRTTVQTPFRWSEDESWREVYARVDETNREALRKEGEARRALQAAKGG
jgi:hypothetical protein